MTTAAQFLTELQALGVTLAADGDRLRFYPRDAVTGDLLARLRDAKPELLAMLQPQDSGNGYTTQATTGGTAVVSPAAPQALPGGDPHGDAADPVTAGSSGTDRPAGQALPVADPLGDAGPQGAHGDATQAHGAAGGAAPPQAQAAAPQATAGPQRRAAAPVAVEWPAPAADFCLLLAVNDLPPVPFRLNPWTAVHDAAKFLRWLQADIRRGPSGPRAFYGALQSDLLALQRFALQPADKRQQEGEPTR